MKYFLPRLLSVFALLLWSGALRAETPGENKTAGAGPIDVFTHTVSSLSHEDQLDNIRDVLARNDRITGVSVRTGWARLQPAPDRLDLESFEQLLAFLKSRGMKTALYLQPGGSSTPRWLKDEGAAFIQLEGQTNRPGSTAGVPWDPVYMKRFEEFLLRLAPRVNADDSICSLAILGHNVAPEMHMPGGPENMKRWAAAGLTREVCLENWQHYIDLYARIFPKKKLLLTLSNSYDGYNDMALKIATYAVEQHPGRIVLMNMQLHGRYEYLNADNPQDGALVKFRDVAPAAWETVGSFHFQKVRQGSVEMTVFNMLKARPLYIQLWNRDAYYDPTLAGRILDTYAALKDMDPEKLCAKMIADGFYHDPAKDVWANNREEMFKEVKASNSKVDYLQKYQQRGAQADAHDRVGIQLWSLRATTLAKGLPASLDLIKEWGFTEVETGGNVGGMTTGQVRAALDERGLKAVSAHVQYGDLLKDLPGQVRAAQILGVKYAICPWIPHEGPFTAATVRQAAGDFNRAGAAFRAAGIRFGYHPHGYEFAPGAAAGEFLLDDLIKATKPEYVCYEMDVFWVLHGGGDPVKLLEKYSGRWVALHVKDLRKGAPVAVNIGHAPATDNVAVGAGLTDWQAVIGAAQKTGVEYYFIEDETPAPLENIPASQAYLRALKL